MLTREQIESKIEDFSPEPLSIPEWGGNVFIRRMDGEQVEAYQDCLDKYRDKDGVIKTTRYRAITAAHSVCDDKNVLMFDDALETLRKLEKKSPKALLRIVFKSKQLNNLSESDLEDLAKNSAGTPGN